MLVPDVRKRADNTLKMMKENEIEEAVVPDSPCMVIKREYLRETDLPLELLGDEYLVIQRRI